MIDLYSAPTPDGWKVSIALEELRIPYAVHPMEACSGERLAPDFLRVSACACSPTIVDHDAAGFSVSDAGPVLVYLAERSGQLMPSDAIGRSRVMQWLMLPVDAADAAKTGDAKAARAEMLRLFALFDHHLQGADYLAGAFSIADIAHWAWMRMHAWSDVDMHRFNALARWLQRVAARDATLRGLRALPSPSLERPAEHVWKVKSILLR